MKRHRITCVLGALSVCGVTLATSAKRSVAADQPDSENRYSNVGAIVSIEDPTHPVIIGSGVLIVRRH
jgi:hypothetical protein